jgi:hypothetical protein
MKMDNSKVVLIEYINDIQVSVIERGDFFKSYNVEVKSEHEVGFSQTYKYGHQAFEMFSAICSVLKMKCK